MWKDGAPSDYPFARQRPETVRGGPLASEKKTDKADVLEKAQRLAARGLIDKAISEWQRLLSATPNDGNIYNTIGDLHLKANHGSDAVSAYLKAAEVFKGAGFELKSAAIYKKIIKIDPTRIDVHEKLADLHADRGLTGNAAEDYLRVAKFYTQRGDTGSALAVYRKISRLDPQNCDIRVRIAETCKKLGQDDAAIEEYEKVRALYEGRKMPAQAKSVLDQILKLKPDYLQQERGSESSVATEGTDTPVLPASSSETKGVVGHVRLIEKSEMPALSLSGRIDLALSEGDWDAAQGIIEELEDSPIDQFGLLSRWVDHYIQTGAHAEAFGVLQKTIALADEYSSFSAEVCGLLQRYLSANPSHLDVYPLLAENLEKGSRATEAAEVYSTLIALSRERGAEAEARECYETLKLKFPNAMQVEAWRPVFEIAPTPPPVEEATPHDTSAPEHISDLRATKPNADEPIQETQIPERVPDIPQSKTITQTARQTLSEATLKNYLTEAEVYIKYKLYAKAIEHLQMVANLAPDRVEPHMQLKTLYIKNGQPERAAVECLILANLYEEAGGQDEKAAILLELETLDPDGRCQPDRAGIVAESVVTARGNVLDAPDEAIAPSETPEAVSGQADTGRFSNLIEQSLSESLHYHIQRGHSKPNIEADAASEVHTTGPFSTTDPQADAPSEERSGSGEASLDAVLKALKKAGRLTPQYLETRYNLGVAYQEMGLLQEAVKEFEMAIDADYRVGEAFCMIARCQHEAGLTALAEETLKRGLADPRCTLEEIVRLQAQIETGPAHTDMIADHAASRDDAAASEGPETSHPAPEASENSNGMPSPLEREDSAERDEVFAPVGDGAKESQPNRKRRRKIAYL